MGADLFQACENSKYKGVMYTNFALYHVPVMVRYDNKVVHCSIRRGVSNFR